MDLTRTRIVLRERAIVDVLDLALRFVVQHGALYAKTTAIAVPPFLLASILVARVGGWPLAWLFCLLFSCLTEAPFTLLASRLVFEDDVDVSSVIRASIGIAPRMFALRIVTFTAVTLGLIFFTFPGIWFLGRAFFAREVLMLEHTGVIGAIARSSRIVRREAGQVVMALLLLMLLECTIVVAADVGGRAVVEMLLEAHAPESMWEHGGSILSLLGFWLFVPYVATARFFVYLDARTRSEGWDIQTRFVAIAARVLPEERSAA